MRTDDAGSTRNEPEENSTPINTNAAPSSFRRKLLLGLAAAPAALYSLIATGCSRTVYEAGAASGGGAKNILIITGSSREGGNSDLLAEAFARGAEEAGHEAVIFSAGRVSIGGCTACDHCWSGDKPCVYDDGFDKLYPLLERADMLVMCSPLYWYSFSTHLKAALDKMYSYSGSRAPRKLKIREAALLMCGETWFSSSFDGPVASYKSIIGYKGWKNRGVMLVTRVHKKGEIAGTDSIAQAEKMGREM